MIVFTIRILIIFRLYDLVSTISAQDATENDVVYLSKDSFAAELERMPHFVLFTFPPSSS